MDTHNGKPSDKQPTLKEVREQRRLIQAQLELRQLEGARQILEAISNPDYFLVAYGDLLDRYRDGGRMAYPLTQPTDRRYGQNYPFWNTETELSILRAQARLLLTMNNYAIGLLNGLQAYVIGDGFQYRVVEKKKHGLTKPGKPSSLVAEAQHILEEFCAVNDWHHWEQELFWRSREDGEYFLRYYPDRELRCLTLRSVEPEQVTATGVPDVKPEWSFGILTKPEDLGEIYAYNILYSSDGPDQNGYTREEVDADQLQHFKVNVHRLVKRGLTDFCFSTYDALRIAEKLRNNMAEGAAVQSALAFLRQHESATQSQVQNFLNNQQLDFSRLNPLTGQAISYKHIEPGSIADIPRGMQYVQPPGAGNASGFVEILHTALRGASCRWNAPEWLATGSGADMAAYTASLTAQAPFVRTAMQKQLSYKKTFKRVIKEAIAVAVDFGRLPPEVFDLLDIQVEAPSIPYKSALDEAQANQIRVQSGWKSRQTVQQEEGLDPEREMQNIEEYNRRMGAADKQGPVGVREYNFNANEPRDERGRWTKGGGASAQDWKDLLSKDQLAQLRSPPQDVVAYSAALGDDGGASPPPEANRGPQTQVRTNLQRIPADRVKGLVEDHLAYESGDLVYIVDVTPDGKSVRKMILQRYVPEQRGEKSLTGVDPKGPPPAYRVVATQDMPIEGGRDSSEVLADMRDPQNAQLTVDAWRDGKEAGWEQAKAGAVTFVYHALPFGAAFDNAAQGNYGEAAISLAGDVAMFLGPLGKAAQLGGTAVRNLRLGAAAMQGGIAAARGTQGVLALRDGDTGNALGYFGEATLRLLGMSKDAVQALKVPSGARIAGQASKSGSLAVKDLTGQITHGGSDLSQAAIALRQSAGIAGGRNVAVFEYIDSTGAMKTIARASERGVGHAERIIAKELESMGVKPSQVTRIYSDLQPCNVPGGYCDPFIRRTFPQAKVTWSFEYGPTPESRAAGVKGLKKATENLTNQDSH